MTYLCQPDPSPKGSVHFKIALQAQTQSAQHVGLLGGILGLSDNNELAVV